MCEQECGARFNHRPLQRKETPLMGSFKLRDLTSCLALLVLPAVTFAVTQPVCKCGPVTPESYKWDFPKEAAGLLHQVHNDAYQAKDAAARLQSFDRAERQVIDWQADAGVLSRERHRVNNWDQNLCRMQIIERELPADQQAEIKAHTPAVNELTDNTQ